MTRFEYVAVSVGDLDCVAAFYREFLGLDRIESEARVGDARTVILAGRDGVKVELIEHPESRATARLGPMERAATQGLTHVAFRVDDLETACEQAETAGGTIVVPPAAARRPGVRFAFVADPEGTLIELVSS